jgi:hypothetical protein
VVFYSHKRNSGRKRIRKITAAAEIDGEIKSATSSAS